MQNEQDPPLPQLDDMLGVDPKRLRLAAEMMKLVAEEVLEGEDWGELKGSAQEVLDLRSRLLLAAKKGEPDAR